MNGCFTKQHRLISPSDFRRVFDTKTRSSDRHFLVLARENGLKHARLGLAVSAKKIKTAVSRNRLKRLVREIFRQHSVVLAGLDVVVVPQKQILLTSRQDLRNSLESHWGKVAKCRTSWLKP